MLVLKYNRSSGDAYIISFSCFTPQSHTHMNMDAQSYWQCFMSNVDGPQWLLLSSSFGFPIRSAVKLSCKRITSDTFCPANICQEAIACTIIQRSNIQQPVTKQTQRKKRIKIKEKVEFSSLDFPSFRVVAFPPSFTLTVVPLWSTPITLFSPLVQDIERIYTFPFFISFSSSFLLS